MVRLNKMKAIIPLAGKGTRLRPHTYSKAKPLLHVAGKPVLAHIIDRLNKMDIEEFIFIIGDLGHQIKDFVEKNYSFKARFIEQQELLGDGHAIFLARHFVKEDVIIDFVDTIFEADLSVVKNTDSDGVVFVHETEDPRRFGIVTEHNNIITDIEEKPQNPKSNLAVIGLYYFKNSEKMFQALKELMKRNLSSHGEYRLADAIGLMIKQGQKISVGKVNAWLDCGKPETLLETNKILLAKEHNHKHLEDSNNSVIILPVCISESAKIKNSIIGPDVSISENVVIENSIIRNSIIDENATVKSCMLSDSIIGANAQVYDKFRKLNVGDSSVIRGD